MRYGATWPDPRRRLAGLSRAPPGHRAAVQLASQFAVGAAIAVALALRIDAPAAGSRSGTSRETGAPVGFVAGVPPPPSASTVLRWCRRLRAGGAGFARLRDTLAAVFLMLRCDRHSGRGRPWRQRPGRSSRGHRREAAGCLPRRAPWPPPGPAADGSGRPHRASCGGRARPHGCGGDRPPLRSPARS